MTNVPLHTHNEAHLYDGSFCDLVGEQVSEGEDLLIAAPDTETGKRVSQSLLDDLGECAGRVELFQGDHTDLPFPPDTFDLAVHFNPGRGVLQRHRPLYEMTAVVRNGGRIVYRAPNYLAHSAVANLLTLYSLSWQNHSDPTLAALMEVTVAGDSRTASEEDGVRTTLGDF